MNRRYVLSDVFMRDVINPATKCRKPSSSLVGIGRRDTLKAKKDSGQARMTKLKCLIAGLISFYQEQSDKLEQCEHEIVLRLDCLSK